MTDELKQQLVRGFDLSAVRQQLRANDVATLRDDAWAKVSAGLTTVEEVVRVLE